MSTETPQVSPAFVLSSFRNMMRALSDAGRAEVMRALIGPTTKGDERGAIDAALAAADDSVTGAAEVLGVSRRTLMIRMRELGYPKRKGGGKRKALA